MLKAVVGALAVYALIVLGSCCFLLQCGRRANGLLLRDAVWGANRLSAYLVVLLALAAVINWMGG